MSDHEYVPSSKFGKWFNDRLPLLSLASHLTDYPTPKNFRRLRRHRERRAGPGRARRQRRHEAQEGRGGVGRAPPARGRPPRARSARGAA